MGTGTTVKKAAAATLSVIGRMLIELLEIGEDVSFLRHHPSLVYGTDIRGARAEFAAEERRREERARRVALVRLRERKWVEAHREGDRIVIKLTRDGAIAALRELIRHSRYRLPAGSFCLVSFDFPEGAKAAREQFRRLLKQSGFRFDHLSVWNTDHDVRMEMKDLVRLLKIEKWVHVFYARRVE